MNPASVTTLMQKPLDLSVRPWISSGGDMTPASTPPFTRESTRDLSAELYGHTREAFGLEERTQSQEQCFLTGQQIGSSLEGYNPRVCHLENTAVRC